MPDCQYLHLKSKLRFTSEAIKHISNHKVIFTYLLNNKIVFTLKGLKGTGQQQKAKSTNLSIPLQQNALLIKSILYKSIKQSTPVNLSSKLISIVF